MRSLLLAGAAVLAIGGAAKADQPLETTIIHGHCAGGSHSANGLVTDDLTQRESRYFCDSAIVESFGPSAGHPNHMLIAFSDSHTTHSLLSFGATMLDDQNSAEVSHVFLVPGVVTEVTEGGCKVYFEGEKVTGIFCGAKIDNGHHRDVRIVVFDADR
jgi:hypothetical protein